MTTTHYAAIDESDSHGAVYGIGASKAAALRDAERLSPGSYRVVPCTPEAAEYVRANGGAPSRDLSVSYRDGVALRSEEESKDTTHCTGCGDEISAASAHWHGEERYCDGCEAAPHEEE